MIRAGLLGAFLLLSACNTAEVPASLDQEPFVNPLIGGTIGLDHILIWSQDQAIGEAYLRDRLGFRFNETPGDYGAGISNKLIWLPNLSFIEFLWLADPEQTRTEAPSEYAFVTTRNGSNAFGLQVTDVDATYMALEKAALEPFEPSAETYDFDGPEGPIPPELSSWRFMFLEVGSMPGNPFFVEYNLPSDAKAPRSDQPNGARRISSVWVLVNDVEAAKAKYERAGFLSASEVTVPGVGNGVALNAGQAEIFLLAPGSATQRSRLSRYGEHVVGISVEVESIAATTQLLEENIGQSLPHFLGPYGNTIRPPALETLGVHIDFHE